MGISFDDDRELVSIRTIDAIEPIPDADFIERAVIGGWSVVVKKGEFFPGEDVVYFEIDACLPLEDERFAFLAKNGVKKHDGKEYHKLRTAKMRGVYSQGLVLPVSAFNEYEHISIVSGPLFSNFMLGIGKWEPELPVGTNVIGEFAKDIRKTDSERIQNLANVWGEIQKHPWRGSLKVDGMSQTLRRRDSELHLYSRNYEIAFTPGTASTTVAEMLGEHLTEGEVIQYELAGPGIQGNPYKLSHAQPFIFEYTLNGKRFFYGKWPEWTNNYKVPYITDVVYPTDGTIEEVLASVDGLKVPGTDILAEGVVFRTFSGEDIPELGRSTFKVISNRYLSKQKD